MACKKCGGVVQQKLNGELSATVPDFKKINIPPVYVCSPLLVCLDCGFAELMVPQTELDTLRKETAAFSSRNP